MQRRLSITIWPLSYITLLLWILSSNHSVFSLSYNLNNSTTKIDFNWHELQKVAVEDRAHLMADASMDLYQQRLLAAKKCPSTQCRLLFIHVPKTGQNSLFSLSFLLSLLFVSLNGPPRKMVKINNDLHE